MSPAERLLGRRPRTRLDIICPNTAERVEKKQMQQKFSHDKWSVAGSRAFAKNFGTGRSQDLQPSWSSLVSVDG